MTNQPDQPPRRVRLSRTKGFRLPPNTVVVSRPSRWGNPFQVGGWFMVGDPNPQRAGFSMSWCQASCEEIANRTPGKFTLIRTPAQAVEFFERLMKSSPRDVSALRGKNLACWCPLDGPCHADTLLRIANDHR